DVDGPVLPGDAGDHDVQAGAVRQQGVHEGGAHVQAATAGDQHPLDDPADLGVAEHDRGQLAAPVARAEDLGRRVQPDLLDARVVEHLLQRAEPADPCGDLGDHRL